MESNSGKLKPGMRSEIAIGRWSKILCRFFFLNGGVVDKLIHVDGSEILHQLRLVVYPIIHRVLYIPGGAGFLPTV